jgi:hypothetical protein
VSIPPTALTVIRKLCNLLRDTADRRRPLLFGFSTALAWVLGIAAVTPSEAEKLIGAGGYYYMLGLFSLFVVYGARVWAERPLVWRAWVRAPGMVGIVVLGTTAVAIWCDPFKHKILFDEYVLQGTAFHMHATKEIGTIIRAYDVWGTWLPIDTFFDKRPYFFTFLLSLLHDLSGYRVGNAFVLNAALAPVCLALVCWLGHALAGRGPALFAVALLGTMPLLGQQASGAGMELHNLTMLALVMVIAILYLRAPSPDRLSLLVLGAVLLAQSRYESAVFVVPVAAVIVAGWLRARRVFFTWPTICVPLLLVPCLWHNRVLSASPSLWQLQKGQTSRFSADYLPGNLEGAWNFFFNFSPHLPNSWYLSILGALAFAWALIAGLRWVRTPRRGPLRPEMFVLVAFGVGIAANLALLMFYYWGRLDDTMASRFALPTCLGLTLLVALALHRLCAWRANAPRWAAAGLALWALTWCLPAIARHTYTSQNLVMQEIEWEYEELMRRPGPLLFITNKSSIPFVLWRVPTIINGVGRQRAAQISYHLREGTFREVIVAQALRPTSPLGEMGVDPLDVMPESYRLESIAEKRFGGRYARLSRLIGIDEPPASPPKGPASVSELQ